MTAAVRILQQIKDAAERHEAPGWRQWYIDEFVIDCDAEEFWEVVRRVLERPAGVSVRESSDTG